MRRLAAFLVAFGPGFTLAEGALEDRIAKIDACIGVVGEPSDHADWCLGVVAQPCLARPESGTTPAMVNCILYEAEAWEAIMNREYSALSETLDAEQKSGLNAAQRAWLSFREADCQFPEIFVRGTLSASWSADCKLQHTADRTLALRGFRDYRAF